MKYPRPGHTAADGGGEGGLQSVLLLFAAGSLIGLELDPDGVRAGNGHRPPKMHLVHSAVIDSERGEVFDPAQQFSMSWDSQAE